MEAFGETQKCEFMTPQKGVKKKKKDFVTCQITRLPSFKDTPLACKTPVRGRCQITAVLRHQADCVQDGGI